MGDAAGDGNGGNGSATDKDEAAARVMAEASVGVASLSAALTKRSSRSPRRAPRPSVEEEASAYERAFGRFREMEKPGSGATVRPPLLSSPLLSFPFLSFPLLCRFFRSLSLESF